jgi:hypothetical protein
MALLQDYLWFSVITLDSSVYSLFQTLKHFCEPCFVMSFHTDSV